MIYIDSIVMRHYNASDGVQIGAGRCVEGLESTVVTGSVYSVAAKEANADLETQQQNWMKTKPLLIRQKEIDMFLIMSLFLLINKIMIQFVLC